MFSVKDSIVIRNVIEIAAPGIFSDENFLELLQSFIATENPDDQKNLEAYIFESTTMPAMLILTIMGIKIGVNQTSFEDARTFDLEWEEKKQKNIEKILEKLEK